MTFLQIAPLSRADVLAYGEIRQALEQSAGRLNGRFAEADWTPIRYLNRNYSHATHMGFLRASQVALVTPVRDGMNLVAKEYVAAQDPEDPGVLILSPMAGAARELTGALQVNPYDKRGMALALRDARCTCRSRSGAAAIGRCWKPCAEMTFTTGTGRSCRDLTGERVQHSRSNARTLGESPQRCAPDRRVRAV